MLIAEHISSKLPTDLVNELNALQDNDLRMAKVDACLQKNQENSNIAQLEKELKVILDTLPAQEVVDKDEVCATTLSSKNSDMMRQPTVQLSHMVKNEPFPLPAITPTDISKPLADVKNEGGILGFSGDGHSKTASKKLSIIENSDKRNHSAQLDLFKRHYDGENARMKSVHDQNIVLLRTSETVNKYKCDQDKEVAIHKINQTHASQMEAHRVQLIAQMERWNTSKANEQARCLADIRLSENQLQAVHIQCEAQKEDSANSLQAKKDSNQTLLRRLDKKHENEDKIRQHQLEMAKIQLQILKEKNKKGLAANTTI